jgi:hypothetical protein
MGLRDQVVTMALEAMGKGRLVPFAHLVETDGPVSQVAIVTRSSDHALHMGRRFVRDRAGGLDEYAIVVDAHLRIEGQRHDALLVEVGTRTEKVANVTGHVYTRGPDGRPASSGAPIAYEGRPSALVPFDPFALDWGAVTPDRWNPGDAHAIRFVHARARYLARHQRDGAVDPANGAAQRPSYSLYADGDLDLFALSGVARSLEAIELFPIPTDGVSPDGVGIALPSDRTGPAAASELRELIIRLWDADAKVFDLTGATQIKTDGDLDQLERRILG